MDVAAPLLSVAAEAERVFRVTVQMKSSTPLFQAMARGLSQYVGFRDAAGKSFFFFYSAHNHFLLLQSRRFSANNFGFGNCLLLTEQRYSETLARTYLYLSVKRKAEFLLDVC